MKNKIIFGVLIVVIGALLYNYVYQDHRNIETEKPEYSSTPQKIIEEFKIDAATSEKKYLNKTIEISGIITEVNKNDLTLNNTVFCQFNEILSSKINSKIKIKGRFIGYDDLFEQVKLDQCSLID